MNISFVWRFCVESYSLPLGGFSMRYGIQYLTHARSVPVERFFDSRIKRDKHALAMVLSGCKLPILYIKKDF
ncbi:hypothetical protein VPHD51_0212 [Vibrio phage D51]